MLDLPATHPLTGMTAERGRRDLATKVGKMKARRALGKDGGDFADGRDSGESRGSEESVGVPLRPVSDRPSARGDREGHLQL